MEGRKWSLRWCCKVIMLSNETMVSDRLSHVSCLEQLPLRSSNYALLQKWTRTKTFAAVVEYKSRRELCMTPLLLTLYLWVLYVSSSVVSAVNWLSVGVTSLWSFFSFYYSVISSIRTGKKKVNRVLRAATGKSPCFQGYGLDHLMSHFKMELELKWVWRRGRQLAC